MVGAPRKVEVERESDSEGDDAPEQVTLSSGREEAQKLRKDQRDSHRRIQADAKQRRQRNTFQKEKEQAPLTEQQDSPATDLSGRAGANSAQDEQEVDFSKPARVSGLLDAFIVDFLSAQEKKVVEGSTQKEEKPQKQKRAAKRKGSQAVISSSSRVKVVLLEADRPSLANCQSALDFKRNRLYGDSVHRSLKMLPKPSSA